MSDDGSRLHQRKIADNLFALEYRGRFFLMQAYPVRVIEVDRPIPPGKVSAELIAAVRGDDQGSKNSAPTFRGFAAVEFIATTHCNLRCTHCTARTFDEDDDPTFYGLAVEHMARETMFAAIDAGIDQLQERLTVFPIAKPVFEMFITGGEPLMVWEDLKSIFQYARKRLHAIPDTAGFVFTPHIVSNGQLVDESIARELAEEETVITIALDSPLNQVRVDGKGQAATPQAIEGIRNLVAAGHRRTSVNVVVDGDDLRHVDDIFSYLDDLGAFDGITTIQMSPLAPPIQHTEHAGKGFAPRTSGYRNPNTCREFSEKLIEYSRRFDLDMKLYGSKLGGWLTQGGTLYRCPVAEWKWCVAPNGDVYACHQLVGIEEFKMGNVHESDWYASPQAQAIRSRFLERTAFKADLCGNCALVSTCMVFVDCPARSYLEEGDIFAVTPHYCECGKTYLEKLLGEHIISLMDHGAPADRPLCANPDSAD